MCLHRACGELVCQNQPRVSPVGLVRIQDFLVDPQWGDVCGMSVVCHEVSKASYCLSRIQYFDVCNNGIKLLKKNSFIHVIRLERDKWDKSLCHFRCKMLNVEWHIFSFLFFSFLWRESAGLVRDLLRYAGQDVIISEKIVLQISLIVCFISKTAITIK